MGRAFIKSKFKEPDGFWKTEVKDVWREYANKENNKLVSKWVNPDFKKKMDAIRDTHLNGGVR